MEVGVDNTLRRKMFRVGGEVNTHGVGITSGLEYRRPGYNAGGPIVKPGPDGKPRQHAVLGGITALIRAVSAASKLQNPFTPLARYIQFGSKGVGKASKAGKGKGEIYGGTVGKGVTRKEFLKKYPNLGGITGPLGRVSQAGRLSNLIGLGSIPFAGASLLAGPRMTPDERKTATDFQKFVDTSRGAVETLPTFSGLGLGAQAIGTLGDTLYESMQKDPTYSFMNTPDLIRKMTGRATPTEETKVTSNVLPESVETTTAMKTAMTQEEQFAKMEADAAIRAEMYYNMLSEGGPDKVRALADAFTNAGMLYDEDKSKALAGFSQGITGELDKDAVLKDEARRLGLTDIVTGEQTLLADAKAKAQAIENAKLAIASSTELSAQDKANTLAQFEAYLEGITEVLPINQDNEMDTNRMNVGRAYFDAQRITGGVFVAVNSEQDIQSFNSAQEALAHAAS